MHAEDVPFQRAKVPNCGRVRVGNIQMFITAVQATSFQCGPLTSTTLMPILNVFLMRWM